MTDSMQDKYIQVDFQFPKGFTPTKEFEPYIIYSSYPTFRVYIQEKHFEEFQALVIKVLEDARK